MIRELLDRARGAVVGYQRWDEVLFLHWAVPAEVVRAHVDARLALDLHGGRAFVSMTPFTLVGARLRAVPPLPGLSRFHELNLRTYVRHGAGETGVWFLSLDAAALAASTAARTLLGLPYRAARIDRERDGARHAYRSRRIAGEARFSARWVVRDAPVTAPAGSLEHFLVERYALYARHAGRLLRVRIRHAPWPLRAAALEELQETVGRAAGVPLDGGTPLVHFSPGVDVSFLAPERVG